MLTITLLVLSLLPPPTVAGPRRTGDTTPTYRFSVKGGAKFRCAFDSPRLHACPARYTQQLAIGRHVLRVRAVDARGRWSPTTVVRVEVLPLQTIRVTGHPVSLADGFGSIWVANYLGGAVLRIDPVTNRVVARVPVGGQPWGLTVTSNAVWVGNNGDARVARIDPATNAVVARVEIGDRPIGIDYDGAAGLPLGRPGSTPGDGGSAAVASSGFVWIADFGDGLVTKIDATTNAVVARAVVPGEHEGVAHGFGSVWVPSEAGFVTRLDPATLAIQASITVGNDPDFALVADGSVWTTAYQDRVISRIDPATNAVASTLPTASGLQGIAFDRSTFWVVNYNEARLLHLDEATGRLLGRWETGSGPRAVLLAYNSVWVANSGDTTITRLALPS